MMRIWIAAALMCAGCQYLPPSLSDPNTVAAAGEALETGAAAVTPFNPALAALLAGGAALLIMAAKTMGKKGK